MYNQSNPGSRNQIYCGEGKAFGPTPWHSLALSAFVFQVLEIVVQGEQSLIQNIGDEIVGMRSGFEEILVYDLALFLGDPTLVLDIWKELTKAHLVNGIYWFRDWYLKIYEHFGGTSVLRNFFNIKNSHWHKTPGNDSEKSLNVGEFVHFWSGAAQLDMYPLVNRSIDSSTEFYAQLIAARRSFPLITYPKKQMMVDGRKVALAYHDDYVVTYYDKAVNTYGNILWPFEIFSQGWKHMKETYGPISAQDKLLHVVLHAPDYNGCFISSLDVVDPTDANLIVCGDDGAIEGSSKRSYVIYHFLRSLLEVAALLETSVLTKIDHVILRGILETMIYDLHMFVKDPSEVLVEWMEDALKKSDNGIYWLRDWFLPIHEQLGGSSALKKFFSIMHYHKWPEEPKSEPQKKLNLGELVHFWSEATQRDLFPTAVHLINESKQLYMELVEARKAYPFVNYTRENCEANENEIMCDGGTCRNNIAWRCNGKTDCGNGLDEANCTRCTNNAFKCARGGCVERNQVCDNRNNCPLDKSDEQNCTDAKNPNSWIRTWRRPFIRLRRVYLDDNVAVYFQSGINASLLVSEIYSKAWAHVKQTYGIFGEHPRLAVILYLHDDDQRNCVSHPSTSEIFAYRNCIECDETGLALEISTNLQHVLTIFATIVHTEADGNPNSETIDKDVSEFAMISINLYDVYVTLRGASATEVLSWKDIQLNRTWNGVYYFRDWFIPIYENYGGAATLSNFYSLAKSQWEKGLRKTTRKYLNLGEFIHFWSGAAGADLLPIALQVFNDSSSFYPQLVEAKKNFPSIHYTASTCREEQFTCEKDLVCIPLSWECNGILECNDGSDEETCTETSHVVPIVVGILSFLFFTASVGVGWKIWSDRRKIMKLQQIRGLTPAEVNDFLEGSAYVGENIAYGPINSMPFISDFEIPREQLVIDEERVLGSGEFGVVKQGRVLRDQNNSRSMELTVAVKMVKPNAKVEQFKAFLTEIKIMAFLGQHQNIASLLGTVTSNIQNCEVFVALEFCSNGDLLHYLRANADYFQDLFHPKVEMVTSVAFTCGKNDDSNPAVTFFTRVVSKTGADAIPSNENTPMSTLDLLKWSRQIADGMNYLTIKKVVHGDLAARNVLLTGDKTAKISDFGLSRQLLNYEIYRKTSESPLPWRWLAIESISSRTFSVHSDVWAFGVTLWEIFTLGQVPYPERRWDHRYINDLANGLRPNSPQFGNDEIYNLMMSSMQMLPAERISFSEISLETQRIKEILISDNSLTVTSGTGSSCHYSVLQ